MLSFHWLEGETAIVKPFKKVSNLFFFFKDNKHATEANYSKAKILIIMVFSASALNADLNAATS